MASDPAFDFRRLSIPERLELVEDIWDSIAEDATPEALVRPLAQADLDDAFAWNEQKAPGLGHEFLRAVAVVSESTSSCDSGLRNGDSSRTSGRRRSAHRRFDTSCRVPTCEQSESLAGM